MEMAEKLYRVLTIGVLGISRRTGVLMREINGNSSKTLPDPGNSGIYNLEASWILCL
jgi:hypothetical protein